ncbi:MAG: hypothetical protein ACFB16_21255 [Phormidesmis sp.]
MPHSDSLSRSQSGSQSRSQPGSRPVYRFCFGVAAGVLSGFALEAMPAQAAAFSFSGSRLTLDTVSGLPETKASTLGTDAIAQTQQGSADNFFDGNLAFVADESTRLDGLFETRSLGNGDGYFGQSHIAANAFAEFLVTPAQPFALNFQFSSLLQNVVDTVFERATAKSSVSLSLLDPNQTVLQFFTLDASVNTSPVDQQSNEALFVNTNGQILNSNQQLLPGTHQETGNISFAGSFAHSVSQPTLLTLQVTTANQSCIQAPIDSATCAKVPDNSGVLPFALVTALGLLFIPRLRNSSGIAGS